jgi:predicted MPP superfamily phosphohydrolase
VIPARPARPAGSEELLYQSMPISRREALKMLAGGGFGAAGGAAAHGYLLGRHALELTRATVPVSGLPPALSGLRIGLMTDVHRSLWVSADDVAEGVRLLMSAQPDLIVLGGDYVTNADRHYIAPSAEALAPLTAPHGVFAILGNHDDDRYVPAALAAHGVEVLKDARTRLPLRNEVLELVGIRYWTRRAADIAAIARGAEGTVILLAHDPRRLATAESLQMPLVLSGHTHGGQIVLPVLGAVAAHGYPVVSGLGRRGRTAIFVSRGLGTVYVPVRINCPPDVALLTLVEA